MKGWRGFVALLDTAKVVVARSQEETLEGSVSISTRRLTPAKVSLLLEEADLPYETVPVDTSKGEQHKPTFRAINPNGKVQRSSIPMVPMEKRLECSILAPFFFTWATKSDGL